MKSMVKKSTMAAKETAELELGLLTLDAKFNGVDNNSAIERKVAQIEHLSNAIMAQAAAPVHANLYTPVKGENKPAKARKAKNTPPAPKAENLPTGTGNDAWKAEKAGKKVEKAEKKAAEEKVLKNNRLMLALFASGLKQEEKPEEKAEEKPEEKTEEKPKEKVEDPEKEILRKERLALKNELKEAHRAELCTLYSDARYDAMDGVNFVSKKLADFDAKHAPVKPVEEPEPKDTSSITCDEQVVIALVEAGLTPNLAEDVALVFPVTTLRKVVETENYDALMILKGVGQKRAELICSALKDRIPKAMSRERIRVPDPEMKLVPNMNLFVDDTGNARLTKNKVRHGKILFGKDGEPVKDVALKRFGPLLQKAAELAGTENALVFTTISQVAEDYEDPFREIAAKEKWDDIVRGGIVVNGEEYVAAAMGTNANMKCQIHWLQKKIALATRTWAMCGANVRKNTNIAKLEAYLGLLLPYTKQLFGGLLRPSMEVLVPEWNHEHIGDNMFIEPNGMMELRKKFFVAEFDGMAVIELTDKLIKAMKLTPEEVKKLKEAIAKFKGGTLRAPFQKGCLVGGFPIHAVLKKMGVYSVQGKDIDMIAIFGDMSVFKAAIGDDGLYKKFEDYCVSFEQLKHRFGVLLDNHGVKKTYLPAQQLQAAHGCDKRFIEQGGREEVEYLKAAQDPKVAAARYLPKAIAEIAQEDPKIAGVWFASHMIKTGYSKELQQSLAGATHDNSISGFVVKDLIAFCEWIAYCEGVRKELPVGCLKAYTVLCPFGGYSGEAVGSRNPVIAKYGLAVVNVVEKIEGEWAWAFENLDFIMVSIHDDLCKRLRMDHDGDKMRLTIVKWFVDAVKSIAQMPFAEWESFGEALKNLCSWDDTQDFFATRTVTPRLGMNVNFAGQVIALGLTSGVVSEEEAEWLMDYMMNKGTDVKQGADGSSCDGQAGEIWKKLKKALKDLLKDGKKPYTIAQAYGKLLKDEAPNPDDVAKEYGDSNLDIVSRIVREGAPRGLKMPNGFAVNDVIAGECKYIAGLVGSGSKKNNYEDAGLFNRLVSMDSEAWKQMDEHARTTGGYADFVAYKRQKALDAFEEFVEGTKYTMADVVDCITKYIFVMVGDQYASAEKAKAAAQMAANQAKSAEEKNKALAIVAAQERRMNWFVVLAVTYCQWFGDRIEEVYCANKALGCLKAVQATVVDDLFDF